MKTSDERGGDNHDDEMWGSDSDSDFVRKEKPQRSQHSRVLNSGRTAKTAPLYIAPALGRGKKIPFSRFGNRRRRRQAVLPQRRRRRRRRRSRSWS